MKLALTPSALLMAGDHFDIGGWRFEVVDMDRHRVDKILLGKTPSATTTPAKIS